MLRELVEGCLRALVQGLSLILAGGLSTIYLSNASKFDICSRQTIGNATTTRTWPTIVDYTTNRGWYCM